MAFSGPLLVTTPADQKRRLAQRFGDIFARIMETTPDYVTVAFRELAEGGVWRAATVSPNLPPC